MEIKQAIRAYWGRKNVADIPTEVSDFIVKIPNSDLKFALKCIEGNTNGIEEYQAKLGPIMQLRGAPNIPVVIAVNDEEGNVSIGVVVSWRFGAPTIERDVTLVAMNEENRNYIYDIIKSSDETIRMLETTNCKVVKHVRFTEDFNGTTYNAEIVYLRDLSIAYRMKGHDEMTDMERLNYYLNGIPRDDYPHDKLDKGIVQAVEDNGYKNVDWYSQLMLFSTELRDIKLMYGNKQAQTVEFLVLPDYSSFSLMEGRTFKPFSLDMYVEVLNNYTFQRKNFTINIPLVEVGDYYSFVDGVKTISSITDFLKK